MYVCLVLISISTVEFAGILGRDGWELEAERGKQSLRICGLLERERARRRERERDAERRSAEHAVERRALRQCAHQRARGDRAHTH